MTPPAAGIGDARSIVAVSGSPSSRSKTAALVDEVLRRLGAHASGAAHIRLSDLDPVALLHGGLEDAALARAMAAVAQADGLVIATPIFKASFSGLLKIFLDLLPQFALAGKVVMPLATGGSPAHVLALDYALRPVLQSMGARQVVQAVFVNASHIEITNDGLSIALESEALLDEAILHFSHALRGAHSSPELLGHPRPPRVAPISKTSFVSN